MQLSVVIPTLNEACTIRKTLRQALACGADEVILVDGGSEDETPEIAREAAGEMDFRLVRSPRGRALQMNAGAQSATGDVLLFLHADTLLPDPVRPLLESALSDPEVVGGRFDLRLDREEWVYRLLARMINLRSRLTKIATGDQAIFVRREVFEKMGGFAELPLMEDVEFSVRLKRVGKVACLRDCVLTSARRWEQGGPFRMILLMWGLRLLYFLGVHPRHLKGLYENVR